MESYLHDLRSRLFQFDDETTNARLTAVAVLGRNHYAVEDFEIAVTQIRQEIVAYLHAKEQSLHDNIFNRLNTMKITIELDKETILKIISGMPFEKIKDTLRAMHLNALQVDTLFDWQPGTATRAFGYTLETDAGLTWQQLREKYSTVPDQYVPRQIIEGIATAVRVDASPDEIEAMRAHTRLAQGFTGIRF